MCSRPAEPADSNAVLVSNDLEPDWPGQSRPQCAEKRPVIGMRGRHSPLRAGG